ncbi:terpene synthase 10-like [Mercurialis annua]|uniref:terpene synthase 10-like n=1 Tax=Mercurialis annua TaxID=3986 RepID=UPI002160B791|nr:terpene synthase 10-like [Mercurialis annua]
MYTSTKISDDAIVRRSANYLPSIWDYDFIQSLRSEYMGEQNIAKVEKLKEEVKMMFKEATSPLNKLEMIDCMQRLGFSYLFKNEIEAALQILHNNYIHLGHAHNEEELHATALEFRLLRQHGYFINQDVFTRFMDEKRELKDCHRGDLKGILNLYEASYVLLEGENVLEEAQVLCIKHLQEFVKEKNIIGEEEYLVMLASHALKLPSHWRMQRLETRWFIDVYEHNKDMKMKPTFLQLAKLEFNMVQAIHQQDLKQVSRWWKKTELGEKLGFARDRMVEIFFWSVGAISEPEYGYSRTILSKLGELLTVIDDIYDIYGSLDELELFTDAIIRWDTNAMDGLPDYMKICFLATYNCINELAFDVLKNQNLHIISYLKKEWAGICKAYLLEAKWYYSGYIPSLQEYLENRWVSIAMPLVFVHAFFTIPNQISEETITCLEGSPDMIQLSSLICGLADDLGTSSLEIKRGDNPKSIQCYMHETGASEEEARKHLRYLIGEAWKKLNKEKMNNTIFSQAFMGLLINMARTTQFIYQSGDGFGGEDRKIKDQITSLFIQPITMID